jgi:hypothetical protein
MDALVHCIATLLPPQPMQKSSVQSPIHRRIL